MDRPMRSWIRRLERAASEGLESFILEDGSRYYYDPIETYKEMFLHACDVQLGDAEKWPEPPEIYRRMCGAKDPGAVLERFKPEDPQRAFVDVTEIYDTDALVRERRLVPLSHRPPEDLSE
jgi:hypothetical protein